MALVDATSSMNVEIFIADTDAYSILFHTMYLKFFERHRLEWLGFAECCRLAAEEGLVLQELATRHVRYYDSARLGDVCVTSAAVVEFDGVAAVFNHTFHLLEGDKPGKLLTRTVSQVGFVDGATGRGVPFPPSVMGGLLSGAAPTIGKSAKSSVFGGGPPPIVGALPPAHVWPHKIYPDLCDSSSSIMHLHALDLFERARSSAMGGAITLERQKEQSGNLFVVGRMDNISYNAAAPARLGDECEVHTRCALRYNKVCLVFFHELRRKGESTAIISGSVSVYSISRDKKPVPIAGWLEALMQPHMVQLKGGR